MNDFGIAHEDGLILEGIVVTLDAGGAANIAPMGPRVDRGVTRLVLRPFATAQTYRNLKATGCGVFHVTDDVELLARAAVGRLEFPPALVPIAGFACPRLADACRWFAFQVRSLDDSAERTTIDCRVVSHGEQRPFFGFNRAKHAALEAAILATRIGILPADEIRGEMTRLAIVVQKTAGVQERNAFEFLQENTSTPDSRPQHPDCMSCVVRVTAPSRLHFGLWSFGGNTGRQFGGVGAMVEQPELKLVVEPAHALQATGEDAARALLFVRRWAEFHREEEPRCRIDIQSAAPEHGGLGSGTQLALSVAAGLNAFCGLPSQTPQELALSVGRGLRSAVGTYGFVFGGLIVEQGKLPGESISPLDCRIDMAEDWRFVLIRPRGLGGLAGHDEADAFSALPEVPAAVTEQLIALARDGLVPAAATGDFALFAESLYRYGRLSGECFAARQGGPYHGPLLTAIVERIRSLGHAGVGQSSWGPTIFAVMPSQEAAEALVAQMQACGDGGGLELTIATPCNRGAQLKSPGQLRANLADALRVPTTMKSCEMHRQILLIIAAAISTTALVGCPDLSKKAPANPSAPAKSQPLVLLVAGDPQLGQAASREWKGRTEEDLIVRNVELSELMTANRLPGDAVIFPSGMIGQLAQRGLIVPLEPAALEDSDFDFRDIFDQVRLREMRWGGRAVAAPLGSPQLLLVYRKDILEKAGLEAPTDWAGYQQAVARLADREALGDLAPQPGQPWHATIEPLAEGWAGQMLLARAAAYAMHRDQVSPLFRFETMAPLIDQPPYVRALEELVAATKSNGIGDSRIGDMGIGDKRYTPAEAFAELQAGGCAMALAWPGPDWGAGSAKISDAKLGFALIPGASEAYRFAIKSWKNRSEDESPHVPLLAIAGRMAAVTSSTSDPRRTQGFVLWLAGRDVSQQIGPHSAATTLLRNSQIATSSRWTGSLSPEASRQYAEALAKTLSLPRAFPGLRLPGRGEYLQALDEAVWRSLGGQPASESLAEAAKTWQQITEKLGVEAQRRANADSLGQ